MTSIVPMGELNGHLGRHVWHNGTVLVWECADDCPHQTHTEDGALIATNVSFCVTHQTTDHAGKSFEGCRFRQLFYFENPKAEDSLVWTDHG